MKRNGLVLCIGFIGQKVITQILSWAAELDIEGQRIPMQRIKQWNKLLWSFHTGSQTSARTDINAVILPEVRACSSQGL